MPDNRIFRHFGRRALALLVGLSAWGAVAAAAPEEVVVMLEAAPKTLDPIYATDAAGVRISHQLIFDTLVSLDDQLRIVPAIATRWERATPTRIRLDIRKGVRFHNGAPLEPEDVVFTLTSLMEREVGSPYGTVLRDKIKAVRRTGDGAVEITLKAPYAAFMGDLEIPVRSRKAGDEEVLLGSGPYRFAGQNVNEIVLERNEAYHGGRPRMGRVVFKVVRDENTRLLKLRKGTADLAINVLPLDKVARFAQPPLSRQFRVMEAPGLSYQYLGFNLRDPVLAKRAVRRAIAHAIDVDALIAHRQKGHSTRAASLLPQSSPFAPAGLQPIPHDPGRARKLLDDARFPERDGRRFTLTYKTSTDRTAIIQARIIQSDLKQVGIEVEVRSFEWGTFYDDISKGNFQLYSLRWIGVTDPDFYYELFHSSRTPPQGRNRGGYANPEVDKLLEKGRLETDGARRRDLYARLQRLLQEELPYVSLWHNNNIAIVSTRLSGFRLHPTGGFQYLPEVRKEAR